MTSPITQLCIWCSDDNVDNVENRDNSENDTNGEIDANSNIDATCDLDANGNIDASGDSVFNAKVTEVKMAPKGLNGGF